VVNAFKALPTSCLSASDEVEGSFKRAPGYTHMLSVGDADNEGRC